MAREPNETARRYVWFAAIATLATEASSLPAGVLVTALVVATLGAAIRGFPSWSQDARPEIEQWLRLAAWQRRARTRRRRRSD